MRKYSRKVIQPKTAFISALICLTPFLVLSAFVMWSPAQLSVFDQNIIQQVLAHRSQSLTQVMVGITSLADAWAQVAFTLIVMVILMSIKKIKAGLWYGLTMLTGSYFALNLLKDFFGRPRPNFADRLIMQGGLAYPSGHSMGSMLMFMGITYLLIKYTSQKALHWTVGIISGIFIGLIGYSRVYLGVHFPSDVLGGFSFGLAWLLASIGLFDRWLS